MNFGYRTDETTAINLIHKSIDAGINFIDTANFYGQPANDGKGQGLTERIVGKALKAKRDQVILATKFTLPMDLDDPNARGGSRRHIIQQCEGSLLRLETDYIDLYQVHRPDPNVPIDETLRALDDLIRAGKVRYIGTSMFPAWKIVEALWISDKYNLNRFVTEQPRYNLLHRHVENHLIPMAVKHDMGILAYGPLQGGILTGKYHLGESYPEDSRMVDNAWDKWAESFLNEPVSKVLDELGNLCHEKGITLSHLAIAWVINQRGVTSAIIGPRTMEQLDDNLKALDVKITDEDQEYIDSLVTPGVNFAAR
jgi:aryl-alcohol dehydrogenase-like predicted oxidoreductase